LEAPLAGAERLLLYIHHERIAPEHQRKGIGGALTRAISDYWKGQGEEHIDASYWYIATENHQSRSYAERSGTRPWPHRLQMLSLEPGRTAPLQPRKIGAGPTFDIVRLINRTHASKELFRPYENVDFGQRLSRTFAYGWGDIYGAFDGERLVAVAGLWKRTIADYGFEAGTEDAMAGLLASLAGGPAAGEQPGSRYSPTWTRHFTPFTALPHRD
jgi:hypothetical protein